MICYKCGVENDENAKFCRSCGAPLTTQQEQVIANNNAFEFDFKKILHSKKFIISFACAVFAILILIIFSSIDISLPQPKLYVTFENNILCPYSPEIEKTLVIFDDRTLEAKINGKASIVSRSTKGDVAAVISEDNVLYIVNEKNIQKIADDVIDAVLSYDGKNMAYVNQDNTLYTIETKSRKIEKIADDVVEVYEFDDRVFSFSPDGNTILYTIKEDDAYSSYIKIGSKTKEFEDFTGLCTSNDGKTIFGFDEDEAFCAYDIESNSAMKLANYADDALFNSNHNEVIFSFDSKYYISINGGERIKIGNYTHMYPIIPDNVGIKSKYVRSVKTFVNTLMYYSEDGDTYGVGFIDENYEMQEIIKNIDDSSFNVKLMDDGDSIYYIRNDNLYFATKKANYDPNKIASEVRSYQITSDNKKIYYVNNDLELICFCGDEEKMIAENVSSLNLKITDDDTVFFLTDYDASTGILYRCNDGKNKIRVADDIYAIQVIPGIVYYYSEFESDAFTADIYVSTNDKDFKKIASGATLNFYSY